ncbi:hypothetical protein RF11_08266 [Thelohanellus kitauei]|uniref:Uncharacterized protein n=1 Tax=Thelohanellus kitauei TaxID=669202 RepID=A0A0C2MPK3_THEKT|nr:hypothetical protein RF11_08266 [Thelohanellus kitauei]
MHVSFTLYCNSIFQTLNFYINTIEIPQKYITNEAHEHIISIAQQRAITVKSIAETFKICRKSVAKHLKMIEEQQKFLPASDKCRNTCAQRNAMFTNMEKTI